MKYLIKDIETKLGKTLRKNTLAIGFDVAEICTGIAVLRTSGVHLYIEKLDVINTKKVDKSIIDKMEYFLKVLVTIRDAVDLNNHFSVIVIEDSFLQIFKNKFGKMSYNPWTYKMLTRFGALVYVVFRKIAKYIYYVQPIRARALVGFKKSKIKGVKIKKQVLAFVNTLFTLELKNDDKADAIVLAVNGLLKTEFVNEIVKPKKRRKSTKSKKDS